MKPAITDPATWGWLGLRKQQEAVTFSVNNQRHRGRVAFVKDLDLTIETTGQVGKIKSMVYFYIERKYLLNRLISTR